MTSTPLLRKEALMIDSRVAILNNSAFGCLTSSLQAAREGYVEEIEKDPYSYHKFHMPAQMLQVNHKLKDYLGVEEHDILHLTSNTSAGIFAALRSILPLQPGDVVMVCFLCFLKAFDLWYFVDKFILLSFYPGCSSPYVSTCSSYRNRYSVSCSIKG